MNLVFGTSDDSKDFWEEVIIPETAEYYSYPEEEIKQQEIRLTALYFAFEYSIGLQIKEQEQKDQKILGGLTKLMNKNKKPTSSRHPAVT